MGNKYTFIPVPEKSELEELYHVQYKSQVEIGVIYNATQKVVFGWFRKLGIVSRMAFKRNQYRQNNSSWKGDNVTYAAYHYRVKSARGKANMCENCGRNDSVIKYDWANISEKFNDVNDYKMMCRSCHFKMDGHRNNFPNRKFPPNINKRKALDAKR